MPRYMSCKRAQDCQLLQMDQVAKDQPNNNAIPMLRANALWELKRKSEAYDATHLSLRLNPKHADSHTKLGYMMMLDTLNDIFAKKPTRDKKQTIINALTEAHSLNPLDVVAQDALSLLYSVSSSGLEARNLTAFWRTTRDESLATIGLSKACAPTMLTDLFDPHLDKVYQAQGAQGWQPEVL